MKISTKQLYILILMLFVLYSTFLYKGGFSGDIGCWMGWALDIHNNGFKTIYTPRVNCNYFPLFLYVLWFYGKLQAIQSNILENIYTLKSFTLIFDFLAVILAASFIKEHSKKQFYIFLLLFNPAFLYNTLIWGQVDAIFSFFSFLSIVCAIKKKTLWALCSAIIAINFKLQAILFFPLIGLLLIEELVNLKNVKQTLFSFFLIILLQGCILLPFFLAHNIQGVWRILTNYVGQYPFLSLNADNLWYLLFHIDSMYSISDKALFYGVSYKNIGFILYIIAVLFVIFPLLKFNWNKIILKQKIVFRIDKILLMASLLPLVFFFFNTEMHERYSHPMLIAIACYSFITQKYFPLILSSIVYFLNLERVLQFLQLTNYNTLVFNPKFIASLYLVLIGYLFYQLYFSETTLQEDVFPKFIE